MEHQFGSQRCHDCSVDKPLHAYARNAGYKGGRMLRCRSCDAARRAARRRGEVFTPSAPLNPPRKRHAESAEAAPEVLQKVQPESALLVTREVQPRPVAHSRIENAAAGDAVDWSPGVPEAPSPTRAPGQVRLVTEHEFVTLLARNIEALAGELRDVADAALQDGRTISSTSDSARDIELQDLERRMTALVEISPLVEAVRRS
jgi:hypothetical protein